MTDEWAEKCKLLKRKILQLEEGSKVSSIAISRGRVAVNRLRLEYGVLLERLESRATAQSESDDEDVEIAEGKRTLKKKRLAVPQPRDPDLPKRPLNPYLV